MFPHQLIWIAIRRIGRQEKQPQFSAQGFNERCRLLGAMRGAAIDNKKDRALGAGNQALQELNEDRGVDAAFFLDHEPHVTARRDRRNQTQGMTGSSGLDDWCFSFSAPGGPPGWSYLGGGARAKWSSAPPRG